MNPPKCFVAVLGDPLPPGKDRVESGVYHPESRYAPFKTEPGNLMLLYCTEGYSQHSLKIPGIGVVLSTDSESVKYRWLPFKTPIAKSRIDEKFAPADLKKFGNRRFSSYWLFEISLKSFSDTVANQEIDWFSV